jgi:hypothetical protein
MGVSDLLHPLGKGPRYPFYGRWRRGKICCPCGYPVISFENENYYMAVTNKLRRTYLLSKYNEMCRIMKVRLMMSDTGHAPKYFIF